MQINNGIIIPVQNNSFEVGIEFNVTMIHLGIKIDGVIANNTS